MVLQKLRIRNFRGFEEFNTSRLNRFTLVAGENNVGKTTLLEAIFMLSGMRLMDMCARINGMRQMEVVRETDLHSIFYAQDVGKEVFIAGDFEKGNSCTLTFRSFVSRTAQFQPLQAANASMMGANLRTSFKQSYQTLSYGKITGGGDLFFKSDSEGVLREFTQDSGVTPWTCIYIPSKYFLNGVDNLKHLIVNKQDDCILKAMQRIDDRIKRLVVNGDKVFVDTGLKGLIPLQLLGDGLTKIVNALAAVRVVGKGGLVCLDEIDNGLHFSAMQIFWDELTTFANERDVQIVATTHDLDFVNAVGAMRDEDCRRQFSYLKLARRTVDGKSVVQAYPYDYAQYASALESGVELR